VVLFEIRIVVVADAINVALEIVIGPLEMGEPLGVPLYKFHINDGFAGGVPIE